MSFLEVNLDQWYYVFQNKQTNNRPPSPAYTLETLLLPDFRLALFRELINFKQIRHKNNVEPDIAYKCLDKALGGSIIVCFVLIGEVQKIHKLRNCTWRKLQSSNKPAFILQKQLLMKHSRAICTKKKKKKDYLLEHER